MRDGITHNTYLGESQYIIMMLRLASLFSLASALGVALGATSPHFLSVDASEPSLAFAPEEVCHHVYNLSHVSDYD